MFFIRQKENKGLAKNSGERHNPGVAASLVD
jgi:hypothetical protein